MVENTTSATHPSDKSTSGKTRPATFTLEEMQRLIAEGVAAALAEQAAKMAAAQPKTTAARTEKQVKTEAAALRAFAKAGYGSVKLHTEVKTYNRWLEA